MKLLKENTDIKNFRSRDQISELIPRDGIGVELGVAEGKFSKTLLEKSELKHLYSIDCWAGDRGHDDEQYKQAKKLLKPFKKRNSILKMRFDEALDLFEDEFFDFIYIDGYAHEGNEQGKTLEDWFPKLRKGGVFAGDDYSEKYPKNIEVIDSFVKSKNRKLHIINDWYRPKSWVVFK